MPGSSDIDGTCTLVATSDGDRREASVKSAYSSAAVNCGLMTINVPSGTTWSIVIEFDSAAAHGVSDKVEVTVP